MKTISVEDRIKIQSHLAEVWKILYANGLEELEHNRTPNSKQKERMSELCITYNKGHSRLTEGFKINVSNMTAAGMELNLSLRKKRKTTESAGMKPARFS